MSNTDDWLQEMAEAVATRAGGASKVPIYNLKITADILNEETGEVSLPYISAVTNVSGPTLWGTGHNGEVIVKIDWSDIDETYPLVSADDVGRVVADYFLGNQFGGHLLIEQPIHLIGHSRGASVNSSLARRLAERNVWVDHMTSLDPHPVDNWGDPKVECWDNIRFADNWFRTGDGGPDGASVAGAQNGNLTGLVTGPFLGTTAHTDVHTFFHGTINTTTNIVAGRDIQSIWYGRTNPFETPWTGPKDLVGFFWSRLGAASTVNNPGDNIVRIYRPIAGMARSIVGGNGSRQTVVRSGGQWPNIEVVGFLDDISVSKGNGFGVTFRFAENLQDALITIGFDNDGNPYNGIGSPAYSRQSSSLSDLTIQETLGTASLNANTTNYVYARISNGTRDRYYYAPGRVMVLPASAAPTNILVTLQASPNPVEKGGALSVVGTATYNTGQSVSAGTAQITFAGRGWTASISNGGFNRVITIPNSASTGTLVVSVSDGFGRFGTNMVSVSVDGVSSFGDAWAVMAGNYYTIPRGNDVDVVPEDVRNRFSPTDPGELWGIFHADNWNFRGKLRLRVIKPDGSLLTSTNWDVTSTPPSWFWRSWGWSDVPLLADAGVWSFDWAFEPSPSSANPFHPILSSQFTYRYELSEHKMAQGVQLTGSHDPIGPGNIFYNDSAKIFTWMNLNNLSENIAVRWQWYEPNGLVNTTYVCEPISGCNVGSPFELPYDYYRVWGDMHVAGTPTANKTGLWKVEVQIKDPWGNWVKQYTDYFEIIEKVPVPPSIAVTTTPNSPFETQSISLSVNATDNTYLKTVVLYWNDGTLHSNKWDNINAASRTEVVSLGAYGVGQQIEYWAVVTDTSGNSTASTHMSLIIQPEIVSMPTQPAGLTAAVVGQSVQFTTGGGSNSLGGAVEYQFDWGDGSLSGWGGGTQNHSWSSNLNYYVTARARKQTNPARMSEWSSPAQIHVGAPRTIAGHIQTDQGANLSNVSLNGLPYNLVTDANGNYTATIPEGWSGTITPAKVGFDFSPLSRSYTNIAANQTAQNYTATPTFVNLDFESASIPPGNQIYIDVSAAIPGWRLFVAEGFPVPTYHEVFTMNYNLATLDSASGAVITDGSGLWGQPPIPVIEGGYSLGLFDTYDQGGPMYIAHPPAYITQQGSVPASAKSIRIRGANTGGGIPKIALAGVQLQVLPLNGGVAGDIYAADCSAYAGSNVELRVSSSIYGFPATWVIDSIEFRADPVWHLDVISAHDEISPTTGRRIFENGATTFTCTASSIPTTNGLTRYDCVGWTGTGSAPSSGISTTIPPFVMITNSSVTWLWQTNYWLDTQVAGSGSVNVSDGWQVGESLVSIAATPGVGYVFAGWSEDVPPGQEMQNPLLMNMTQARSVTANFILPTMPNVIAWGDNSLGQTNVPSSCTNIVAISSGSGGFHTLTLRENGTAINFGRSEIWGQSLQVPESATNIAAIGCGGYMNLIAFSNGLCHAWGRLDSMPPPGLTNVTAVEGGFYNCLALLNDGHVVGWGWDHAGQNIIPSGLSQVVSLASGGDKYDGLNLALRDNGAVVAWGSNSAGQTNVPSICTNIVAITAGARHAVALRQDGLVVCWGDNSFGQTNVPLGMSDIVAIDAGWVHCLALRNDGVVFTWGGNTYGECSVPAGLNNVVGVAAGYSHSVALIGTGNPTITVQPWSRNVSMGSDLRLAVMAAGIQPLNYEWRFNGVNIAGATSNHLALSGVQFDKAGDYAVVVSNTLGVVTSKVATLTVTLPSPVVHSIQRSAGREFSFQVTTVPGLSCFVEASTNLVNWQVVMTTNTTTSNFRYEESDTGLRPLRFYRVRHRKLLPSAGIESVNPSVASASQTVVFTGVGISNGDPITSWEWRSDVNGLIGTSQTFSMSATNLAVDVHNISLRVSDNGTDWSVAAIAALTVNNASPTATLSVSPLVPPPGPISYTFTLGGWDNDENGNAIVAGELLLDGNWIANRIPGTQFTTNVVRTGVTRQLQYRVRDDEGTWGNSGIFLLSW